MVPAPHPSPAVILHPLLSTLDLTHRPQEEGPRAQESLKQPWPSNSFPSSPGLEFPCLSLLQAVRPKKCGRIADRPLLKQGRRAAGKHLRPLPRPSATAEVAFSQVTQGEVSGPHDTSRMRGSHRKHLEVVAGVTSRELGSQLTQSQNSHGKIEGYELRAGHAAQEGARGPAGTAKSRC